ncbi:Cof-type HAD-IIB family hydrolase [Bacillus aerolatus]|uniref:Cof-type HAD-IIB family hydrolase n=1 Tax=Bacillus aerolatus TaxID=2653354 RepID=A0A6I1FJS4_9BACI|nr:Cof-type HAD-IIB family hydrolase [Bacillus aerolatus]KAB7706674.1 Cof-type HAD-IIB family hydrolase [Bacillus aerolatus]
MYKMIAIDLDGTLLNDELIVSPRTVEAIQKAVERGTVVTVATGRMFRSAKQFAQQLGLNVPLITYQGALIQDVEEKEVMYERPVPPKIAHKLIEIANEKNMHLQVYQDDILYAASDNDIIRRYADAVKVPYTVEPDLAKLAERGFTKALFIDAPNYIDDLQNELRELFGERANIAKSKPTYLEVTHPEADKGIALLHLAQKLGIDRSEIIGIGDNYNDLDLITTAGLGVAMGNGVDELKERADYISLSNNEDGVGHVIEKFVLQPAVVAVD